MCVRVPSFAHVRRSPHVKSCVGSNPVAYPVSEIEERALGVAIVEVPAFNLLATSIWHSGVAFSIFYRAGEVVRRGKCSFGLRVEFCAHHLSPSSFSHLDLALRGGFLHDFPIFNHGGPYQRSLVAWFGGSFCLNQGCVDLNTTALERSILRTAHILHHLRWGRREVFNSLVGRSVHLDRGGILQYFWSSVWR